MPPLKHQPPLPFSERVSSQDLELRGVRARAFGFKDGLVDPARAVVCIAGMGADGRSFARQRPLASEWMLLPLNMPFETPPDQSPLTFAADVIEEFLDAEKLERPVLVGSSFGGAVATLVALRRQERIRALVLANAVLARNMIPLAWPGFIDLLEAPEPLARLVAPMAAQLMGGFALDRDARDEIVREARHFASVELQRRLLALLRLDLAPRLHDLRVPTLWVHGSRDLLVPSFRAKQMAAHMHARFELVKGAGHLPYLSHPGAFNAALTSFLGDVVARERATYAHARGGATTPGGPPGSAP